jgi:general stress protein CsbA
MYCILCVQCAGFLIPAVLVILFLCNFLQHRITYDGWVGRHKLATLIYVSLA